MALTDKLTAIANAIRAKTSKTDLLTLDDMPTEIENIKTGDTTIEDGLVSRTLTEYTNDRVTSVGAYAFNQNKTIKSVTMLNVTSIGTYAFCDCTALESVNIPNLTTNSDRSFQNNTKLKSIDFPLLEDVGRNICYGCSELESVNLPRATKLGWYVFTNCKKLTVLDFPLLTYIEGNSFQGCSALVTLILRSSTLCTLNATNALASTPIATGTGYIYVPSALVEEYKSATNWSTYAEQIRAIEDYPEITGGATI